MSMDVQRFAETPIEPRLAQWMDPDFADPAPILFAGSPSSSLVEDRQISAPFGHSSGDFICEWCESALTRFGQVASTVRIMDHIYPSPVSTLKRIPSNCPTHTNRSATMRSAMPQAIPSLKISHFPSLYNASCSSHH